MNGSDAISAPWKISNRLPSGSWQTIKSLTSRSSASAREPRATLVPACFEPRRQRIERSRVGDLPAEHADAVAAVRVDDDALLAVIHAERQRRARLVDALQAEQPGAIARPITQILGADADIAESLYAHRDPR